MNLVTRILSGLPDNQINITLPPTPVYALLSVAVEYHVVQRYTQRRFRGTSPAPEKATVAWKNIDIILQAALWQ